MIGSRLGESAMARADHSRRTRSRSGGEPWRTFRWPSPIPRPCRSSPPERLAQPAKPATDQPRALPDHPREGEGRFDLADGGRTSPRTAGCERRRARPMSSAGCGGIVPRSRSAPSSTSPRKAAISTPASTGRSPCARRPDARRFPDDFVFPEDQPMTSVAKQIGNAVPCLLAQAIGNSVVDAVARADELLGVEREVVLA